MPLFRYKALSNTGENLDGQMEAANADEVIEEFGLRRFQRSGPIYLYRPKPSPLSPTGYLGRSTIMEFLVMTDDLRRLVMQRAGMGEIEEAARGAGIRTMYEDGLFKAMQGTTTIEEVLRVTQES